MTDLRVLAIARTDRTFEPADLRGEPVLVGQCLHCNAHLVVGVNGRPHRPATVEHIVARHHGGTDALDNLALACARCNHAKGASWDVRPPRDPELAAYHERLLEKRRKRWRDDEITERYRAGVTSPEPDGAGGRRRVTGRRGRRRWRIPTRGR
jgi:hypothetical protein